MKSVRIAGIALAGLVWTTAAFAQTHHEIALTRAEIQTERQAIVAANLPMTEEQAKAFWPLYREYRDELAKAGDRTVALIESYAADYKSMDDAKSQAMIDEFFSIRKDETKIMSSWMPKFGKVLPATSVARFLQIENKLDAIIRFELAAEIPLVESAPKADAPKAGEPQGK